MCVCIVVDGGGGCSRERHFEDGRADRPSALVPIGKSGFPLQHIHPHEGMAPGSRMRCPACFDLVLPALPRLALLQSALT